MGDNFLKMGLVWISTLDQNFETKTLVQVQVQAHWAYLHSKACYMILVEVDPGHTQVDD